MEIWQALLLLLSLQSAVEIPHSQDQEGIVQSPGEVFSPEEIDFWYIQRDMETSRRCHLTALIHRRATITQEESPAVYDLRLTSRLTVSPLNGLTIGARWDDCAPGPVISGEVVSGFVQALFQDPSISIVLGDYSVETGQGLLFWGPELIRGGTGVFPRRPCGVRPLLASPGTRSLRGVGLNGSGRIGSATVTASVFLSERTLSGSGSEGIDRLAPLIPGTDFGKNTVAVRERLTGMSLRINAGRLFTAAVSGFTAFYSELLSPRWLTFPGRMQTAGISADVGISGQGFAIAGEWAFFGGGGRSGILSCTCALGDEISCEIVYHARPKGIASRHSSPPGYAPEGSEESGYGVSVSFFRRRLVSGSLAIDQSRFSLSEVGPTGSRTRLSVAAAALFPEFGRLTLQVRASSAEELTATDLPGTIARAAVDSRHQVWVRSVLDISPGERISLRIRFDATLLRRRFSTIEQRGDCLAQEIRWQPVTPLVIEGTILLFGTASYDSRLYWMESGTPRTFALIPLYGRGQRWMVSVRSSLAAGVRAALRLAGAMREEGMAGKEWRGAEQGLDIAAQLDVLL